MNLTGREKEMLKAMIDNGQPLPPKYRLSLFADASEVELIWQGKTSDVTNVVLPFQSIEQIDEPRAETHATAEKAMGTLDMFALDRASGRQASGWTNKLIWGDNKLVLSSLKNGPLRREIEAAGGLKLIYIDPPFDVGADFSFSIEIGEGDTFTKEPSVLEEIAYRDTWGKGTDSFVAMIFERLSLMRDLLSDSGSIYLHCDWRVSAYVRLALDEVFGPNSFVNEIIWRRAFAHNDPTRCGNIHDTLFYYSKTQDRIWNKLFQKANQDYVEQFFDQFDPIRNERYNRLPLDAPRHGQGGNLLYEWKGVWPASGRTWAYLREQMEEFEQQGRIHYPKAEGGKPRLKRYESEHEGTTLQDIWSDVNKIHNQSTEQLNYPTQKPESLLDRVIQASTSDGDLIADFFCGSGTTLAVAEKLGRKWIGCDLGRFAIHTSRKRLIGVQRQLKAENKPYRAFEILNLGKYERQFFVGIDPTLPEEERINQAVLKEEQYLSLILGAYKAERVESLPHVQGRKGNTLVYVGPVDAPVTLAEVNGIVETCRTQGWSKIDIIAFEYEMGLHPYVQDEARARGVSLALKYIPKDVFDKRAIERNQVQFYDAAFVEAVPKLSGRSVTVTLSDFGVFYGQDDAPELRDKLKPGGNRVSVVAGQVMRLTKDKLGLVTEERLTKTWTDWIDYWAIDFEFESKPEIIRIVDAEGTEREVKTGNFIFENEWQSFRTRKDRKLEMTSAAHAYPSPGRWKIAVKVIDIFGNDTTKVIPVEVA